MIATSSLAAIGAMAASLRLSIALAVPLRAFGLMQLEAATAKSCIHLPSVPGGRGPPDLAADADAGGQNGPMLIVRATRKLLGRLGPITADTEQRSTTLLGDWYATAWFWRPQVALLVSETTLLPVLMPLNRPAPHPRPRRQRVSRFGPKRYEQLNIGSSQSMV